MSTQSDEHNINRVAKHYELKPDKVRTLKSCLKRGVKVFTDSPSDQGLARLKLGDKDTAVRKITKVFDRRNITNVNGDAVVTLASFSNSACDKLLLRCTTSGETRKQFNIVIVNPDIKRIESVKELVGMTVESVRPLIMFDTWRNVIATPELLTEKITLSNAGQGKLIIWSPTDDAYKPSFKQRERAQLKNVGTHERVQPTEFIK